MAETRFCQQWNLDKGTFVLWTSAKTKIHPRIVLAWIAVESGGEPQLRGHNYLQIKGEGDMGRDSRGFAVYSSPLEAAKRAALRINQEPGIRQSIGKGPERVMKAIAETWDDGPGVTRPGEIDGYFDRLKSKFYCIDKRQVKEGGFLGVMDPGGQTGAEDPAPNNALGTIGNTVKEIADTPLEWIEAGVAKFLDELWPVLLKTALAGTGLALIGYGIVKATGSGTAAEHVKSGANPAAAAAQAARKAS